MKTFLAYYNISKNS